jgi:hypothetical protein
MCDSKEKCLCLQQSNSGLLYKNKHLFKMGSVTTSCPFYSPSISLARCIKFLGVIIHKGKRYTLFFCSKYFPENIIEFSLLENIAFDRQLRYFFCSTRKREALKKVMILLYPVPYSFCSSLKLSKDGNKSEVPRKLGKLS